MAASQSTFDRYETLWGVISYVPADMVWCEWLYFVLNGYPVPLALAHRATRDGFALPEALSFFPDPDDPECASDYAEALKAGHYLILVCSPNSAQCSTVASHIRDFKRAGGEERIIVLIVEGEPNSGRATPTNGAWLPPWLRWRLGEDGRFREAERSEPRIIDARPGRGNLDEVMGALMAALVDVPKAEWDRWSGVQADGSSIREGLFDPEDDEREEGSMEPIAAESIVPPPETPPRYATLLAGSRILAATGVFVLALAAGAIGFCLRHPESGKFAPPPLRAARSRLAAEFSEPRAAIGGSPNEPAAVSASERALEPKRTAASGAAHADPTRLRSELASSEVKAGISTETAEYSAASSTASRRPAPESEFRQVSPSRLQAKETPAPQLTPETSTPDEISRQNAIGILQEAAAARVRADQAARSGGMANAFPLYLLALDRMHQYAAICSSDSSAELERAKLCLVVGAIQADRDSTAEARQTLQTGRKILLKMKGKGAPKDRSYTLDALQDQIRRLGDDGTPRRLRP